MESGTEVIISGHYVCLYHQKNKILFRAGCLLPECNFAGVNCKGHWHLIKEVKEKSFEEKKHERDNRIRSQDIRKSIDTEARRKRKEQKPTKWDFEKW